MASLHQQYTAQLLEIKTLLAQAKDEEVIDRLRDLAAEAVEILEVPFEYVDGNGHHGEIEWEGSDEWNDSGCSDGEWESSGC
tara:strand:+ start:359 stop:604 length:246 start_codon:yes stop_codon:yes gene_type:complete